MKIVIQFSKKYRKPEDIVRLMKRENINELILQIINNKDIRGLNIKDYRNTKVFTIYFDKMWERKK